MLINRGNFLSALRPGVHAWFGAEYNRYPDEYSQIFDVLRSNMNFEKDVNQYGFGMAVVKPEGTNVEYDTMGEGYAYNYVHVPYALGFSITHEAMMDNLYMKVAEDGAKKLGFSLKQAKETVCANILNRAFNNSYTFADGVELCSTANIKSGGGTWANKPAVDIDLSENAIEQSIIDIGKFTDDRGLKIKVMPRKAIIPVDLEFELQRILKSELRVSTADNDLNILKAGMYLPEGYVVNHYLTDTDAWFIKTDCLKGLQLFQREDVITSVDTDFNSDNLLSKAYERYSVGCTDKHSIYGSQGA